MTEDVDEYYKKGLGSISLLSYHIILPFADRKLWVSNIVKSLPEGHTFLSSSEVQAEIVLPTLRETIAMACRELQYKLIKFGRIRDDGVVEVHSVFHEKYVVLYLKLPATVSVSTAVNHIRTRAFYFLRGTKMQVLLRRHSGLFSAKYLATCAAVDPYYTYEVSRQAYKDCCELFMLENGLHRDRVTDARLKKSQLGKEDGFMSDRISIYD